MSYVDVPENNNVELIAGTNFEGEFIPMILRSDRLLKNKSGFLVYNPETDTIYQCNHALELTPVMAQTPSVSSLKPMLSMNTFFEAGGYQFIEVFTVKKVIGTPRAPSVTLARDMQSGQIYTAKVMMDDYEGQEFEMSPRMMKDVGLGMVELQLPELQEALEAGKLKGKLKETVEAQDAEGSNVYVMVELKE
jgi:hypothetical protein